MRVVGRTKMQRARGRGMREKGCYLVQVLRGRLPEKVTMGEKRDQQE